MKALSTTTITSNVHYSLPRNFPLNHSAQNRVLRFLAFNHQSQDREISDSLTSGKKVLRENNVFIKRLI